MENRIEKKWLTNKEVCKYLGISNKTWFTWRTKNLIPHSKINGIIRTSINDIDAFVESQKRDVA